MNTEEDFKWYIDLVAENGMNWDIFKKILMHSPEEIWPKSSLVLLVNELSKTRKELDELKNYFQQLGDHSSASTNAHQDKNNALRVR